MDADVRDPVDADEPCGVLAGAAAHAGDERVAAEEAAQRGAGLVGDSGVLRARDDRRERPVHVEQDRRALRLLREARQGGGDRHQPRIRR